MDRAELTKRYMTAAIAAAGIVSAIVFYTVVVEILAGRGYAAPLRPPAAYALKYGLYILGVSCLALLKLADRFLPPGDGTPDGELRALTKLAMVKAALCELPAVCGLILFLLTGGRADFYMLAVFSLALEIHHFPRLPAWEEKLRGLNGRLPQ